MKQLRDLPKRDASRVFDRLEGLATEPRPAGCAKLAGFSDAWRLRVGMYRVVYRIDDAAQIVTVTRVGHRKDVYRRR